jgi:hypothetical protein
MAITPLKKTKAPEGEGPHPNPGVLQARFYYTKRVADNLQAEAEKKAAKEAERQRLADIAEEDRRKRYEIVDHVRGQMAIKDAQEYKTVVEEVAEKA